MGKFINMIIGTPFDSFQKAFCTFHFVQTSPSVLYYIYILATNKIVYKKSTDGGFTWGIEVPIDAVKLGTQISIWYDRWSGINADLIHIAFTDSTTDDVYYCNINTASSDTLSSVYTVFAGSSTADNGTLSITRTRGGNLICGGAIDAGTELFCYKSTNVGVNWSSIAAVNEAGGDQLILLPGWAADDQDAMCFFWDASADEISRKLYDDSGNSWSEASISGSMIDIAASSYLYPQFSAAVDITNSQNILVAWSNQDTLNSDLRCWKVTEASITEMTNVVLNSTDDQGVCGISIDVNTNYWYVFYLGKSDGSETFNLAVKIYYKVSRDGGTTWGNETAMIDTNVIYNIFTCPRFYNPILAPMIAYPGSLFWNTFIRELTIPHSTYQLGM